MAYTLDRDTILDLEGSLKREYLLTNGKGGYCASTVLDCHMRKYHGLLVLPVPSLENRKFVLLSKLEPVVGIDDKFFRLSTNKFPFVYEPQGHKYMESFAFDLYPETVFRMGDTEVVRSCVMPYGGDEVLVRFDVRKAAKRILLKVTPLLAYREIHALTRENIALRPRPYPEENGFKIAPYEGMPDLYVQASRKGDFYPAPLWFKNIEYMKERNRGYPYQEDLFSPGVFEFFLKEGETLIVRAGLAAADPAEFRPAWNAEVKRLEKEAARFAKQKEPLAALKRSAWHYLVKPDSPTEAGVTAGYHWFGEWGRDTMISLHGLTLSCGRPEAARNILLRYAALLRDGALPNIVGGAASGHAWNSADAALLFVRAVRQYAEATGDRATVGVLMPACRDALRSLAEGRNPLVRIGEDGLLYAGNATTQLTWMDAVVEGRPVTPRHGAAVELNALWHDGLRFCLEAAPDAAFASAVERFERSFLAAFWSEETACFADVYRSPSDRDLSIRPNQLFVLASPYPFVPKEQALRALETVKAHLVTPYGLRTLSPSDPAYRSEYKGPPEERDRAYHQGMVWPWLVGVFAESLVRWEGVRSARKYVETVFEPLWTDHLHQACLGHISEIFKPDPPHVPKGAVAQAWSLAESIRALELVAEGPRKGAG